MIISVSLLALTNSYVAGTVAPICAAILFYNGTEAEFNTAFAGFLLDPTSIKALGPLSYNDITKVLPPGSARTNGVSIFSLGLRKLYWVYFHPLQNLVRIPPHLNEPAYLISALWKYGASALYPSQGLFEQAFMHWTNFSDTFRNEMMMSTLAFTPITQNHIDVSNANGGTAFSPPNGEKIWKHFTSNYWLTCCIKDLMRRTFPVSTFSATLIKVHA